MVDVLWGKKESIIRKWYVKGEKILDVGCREAEFSSRFDEKKTGIDINDECLEKIKKMGIETHKADLNKPFALNKTFKNVFCLDVLEHLVDPLVCAKSCQLHLDDEGVAFFSVPYFGFWKRVIASMFYFDSVFGFETEHIRFYSPREFRKMLRMAGFRIIKEYKIGRFWPVYMNHLIICKKETAAK